MIKIYGDYPSPFCRIVFTVCDVLGLEYDLIVTSPIKGDCKTPEFLRLNFQHNIPVLVEDDFVLNESRAIAVYLAQKHDKTGKLYPKDDLRTQAVINNRLCYDQQVLQAAFQPLLLMLMFGPNKPETIPAQKEAQVKEAVSRLNTFLKHSDFVASTNHPTVADYVLLSHFSNVVEFKCLFSDDFDLKGFPETLKWFEAVKKTVPNYYEVNNLRPLIEMFLKQTGVKPEDFRKQQS